MRVQFDTEEQKKSLWNAAGFWLCVDVQFTHEELETIKRFKLNSEIPLPPWGMEPPPKSRTSASECFYLDDIIRAPKFKMFCKTPLDIKATREVLLDTCEKISALIKVNAEPIEKKQTYNF